MDEAFRNCFLPSQNRMTTVKVSSQGYGGFIPE